MFSVFDLFFVQNLFICANSMIRCVCVSHLLLCWGWCSAAVCCPGLMEDCRNSWKTQPCSHTLHPRRHFQIHTHRNLENTAAHRYNIMKKVSVRRGWNYIFKKKLQHAAFLSSATCHYSYTFTCILFVTESNGVYGKCGLDKRSQTTGMRHKVGDQSSWTWSHLMKYIHSWITVHLLTLHWCFQMLQK